MGPEFRFPRSTVFLMCVILAGVVLAINQAKTIVLIKEALPSRTTAAWHPLLWSLLFALGVVLAAAAMSWKILFVLRQTGTHRLGNVEMRSEQH